MRIIFIGNVIFSKAILERLIELKADIVGVITKKESALNADFVDLSDISKRHAIPCSYAVDINSKENVEWIKKLNPDILFCFGFSHILKNQILEIAPMGVVGFHPAMLPQNRARHPIIWALILGLDKTASTFFFMDGGIDSGDILNQIEVKIDYEDSAHSLYDKIINTASKQIENLLHELQTNTYNRVPQDHAQANYWRRRNKKDGQLDFRMDSRTIYNLTRALTRPYVGAHLTYKDKEVKVWEAKETESKLTNAEYGKVLDVTDNKIVVKCSKGAVVLTKHEFTQLPKEGEYLL